MTRIAELRKLHHMTQKQLALQLIVDQTTVSLWELEKGQPDADKLYKMAQIFGVSMEYLIGKSDVPGFLGRSSPNCVPIYSRITGTQPDERDCIGYEIVPMDMLHKDVQYIGLHVADDHMWPRLIKGDVVILRAPASSYDGRIAAVSVEHCDVRIRRVKQSPSGLLLQALNPDSESEFYTSTEVRKLPVTLWGTVVQTIRREKE